MDEEKARGIYICDRFVDDLFDDLDRGNNFKRLIKDYIRQTASLTLIVVGILILHL